VVEAAFVAQPPLRFRPLLSRVWQLAAVLAFAIKVFTTWYREPVGHAAYGGARGDVGAVFYHLRRAHQPRRPTGMIQKPPLLHRCNICLC
ncbi:hypothetical protein CFC21_112273, partial [Triticum aestivum]|nr:hypothetical protein [Triticum aestivum]